jgi:hypothetical protein
VDIVLQSITNGTSPFFLILLSTHTLQGASSRGKKSKTRLKIFYVVEKMTVKAFFFAYWPGVEREVKHLKWIGRVLAQQYEGLSG